MATQASGPSRPRLVHERTVVIRPPGGRIAGYLGVPANDEFVVLTSKGWYQVHDMGTGAMKFKYRHPDVAQSYHVGLNKPDRITVDCTLARDAKYYMMKSHAVMQPDTVLDVNVTHSLKDTRYKLVNYRTGETEADIDLAAHELGQHASGGYRESGVFFTKNYRFILGPVPPEGRLASVDARTGKVHRIGPALEWGYPSPYTPPVFLGIGGDWVLVGRQAPFLWNARTGETGASLDVAAARAWHDAHPTGAAFDLYGAWLAGPAAHGDANDLRGRYIISGGHVFDAFTGAWVARLGMAGYVFTGTPTPPGFHDGLVLTAGCRSVNFNDPKTKHVAWLRGFDPETKEDVLISEAEFGIACPLGVPPDRIKTMHFTGLGISWTPNGHRFLQVSETSVVLDCWPALAAWARQHPSNPAYARFVLDNDLRRGLLRGGDAVDAVDAGAANDGGDGEGGEDGNEDGAIVWDMVAIKDAAEAWARSGFIATGTGDGDGDGQRLVQGSGPGGELDLRDVRDVLGIDTDRVAAALGTLGLAPGSRDWLRARRAQRALHVRDVQGGTGWGAGAGTEADAAWQEQVDVLAGGWDVRRIQVDIFKILFE